MIFSLDGICKWAADLGFKGIQMPTLDTRFIDLQKAAESKTYAEMNLKGTIVYD
jgi:sugar phosphate isomerase/epimerase